MYYEFLIPIEIINDYLFHRVNNKEIVLFLDLSRFHLKMREKKVQQQIDSIMKQQMINRKYCKQNTFRLLLFCRQLFPLNWIELRRSQGGIINLG